MLPIHAVSALALAAALSSCSSTRLVSEHVGPAALESPLTHVVVIGVSDEIALRAQFETAFAGELRSRAGIDASGATTLVHPERSLDRDALRAALDGLGFDGVLVVRKLGERAEVRERRTGAGIPEVDVSAYDDFHGRYLHTLGTSTSDVATRMVRAEITLLRGADYEQVWTGVTDSHDPRELDSVAVELAAVVVSQLRAHGLL